MAPEKHQESILQALPDELLGKILAKVGESSAPDLANVIITCKKVHASSANPKIYKMLSLAPFVRKPLIAYNNMPLFQKCLDNNNIEALLVQGILSYFAEEDMVKGLDHLRAAAERGHVESTYLYGILMLCNGHIDEGKKAISKIDLVEGSSSMEACWESLKSTLHGIRKARRMIYLKSLRNLKPPTSCHKNDLNNTCDQCLHYKQMKKFVLML